MKISRLEDGILDPSRRNLIKLLAGAPLLLTAGFAGEALMRFAKPSMKAGGFFESSDQPEQIMPPVFVKEFFPEPWICLEFMYTMKVKVFSPQQEEIRSIPSFIIRLDDERIVAYDRECPHGPGCLLNFVRNPREHYDLDVNNPALICCCHNDAFDLANDGASLGCRFHKRPRQFEVLVHGDRITIGKLDASII